LLIVGSQKNIWDALLQQLWQKLLYIGETHYSNAQMSSKRKSTSLGLERRVRARREKEWEPELGANDDESSEEESAEGNDSGDENEDEDSDEAESGSEVCAFW
jgi:hypothetical protein